MSLITSKVVVPFWCLDALLGLQKTSDHRITQEWLSRLECLAEAVVCHDTVLIPDRYFSCRELKPLLNNSVFEPLQTGRLVHSWDLRDGITVPGSDQVMLDGLSQDWKHWNEQLHPETHMVELPDMDRNIAMLRLWNFSSVIEASVHHDSSFILPISLRFDTGPRKTDLLINYAIDKMRRHAATNIASASSVVTVDPLLDKPLATPIFLALALSRAKSINDLPSALLSVRKDLVSIRKLRHSYISALVAKNSIGEIGAISSRYTSAVDAVLSDGATRSFFGRTVSAEEISTSIFDSMASPVKSLKFVIKHLITQSGENKMRKLVGGVSDLKDMIFKLKITDAYCSKLNARGIC